MKLQEVKIIIEDILDTLIEVGNGTTDQELHEACDLLFRVRDEYLNNIKEEE